MDYQPTYVHIPPSTHVRLMKTITDSRSINVKIDLTGVPGDKIYVTARQIERIRSAVESGRIDMLLRFSWNQIRHNIETEGGFVRVILCNVARFIPTIFMGLSVCESLEDGDGMFFGGCQNTFQLCNSEEEGVDIRLVGYSDICGFYIKHAGRVYIGEELVCGQFLNVPIINLLL